MSGRLERLDSYNLARGMAEKVVMRILEKPLNNVRKNHTENINMLLLSVLMALISGDITIAKDSDVYSNDIRIGQDPDRMKIVLKDRKGEIINTTSFDIDELI